jgi:hypothetical protein
MPPAFSNALSKASGGKPDCATKEQMFQQVRDA